jgi:hypothetical protein
MGIPTGPAGGRSVILGGPAAFTVVALKLAMDNTKMVARKTSKTAV